MNPAAGPRTKTATEPLETRRNDPGGRGCYIARVRAIVLSTAYADPATREKLHALSGLGVDVTVATPGGQAAVDGALRLVPIPVRGSLDEPVDLRWNARSLRRVLVEQRPDLVHVEDEPESLLAGDAARVCQRLGVPFVLSSWLGTSGRLGLLERRRAHRTLARAAAVIGASERAREALARHAPPSAVSAVVLPTGVTLAPRVRRPAPTELCLGFAGRLVPERGLDRLLEALAQTYGKWRLIALGTGPHQEALEELAQRHGLASRVEWRGGLHRDALATLFDDIDVLVLPFRPPAERIERHPPVLLDAMSRGLAVLVSTAEPLPELVGEAGLVFEDREALTRTLQQLTAEPARTRELGERARQRVVQHFTATALAERTLGVWQRVSARGGRDVTAGPDREASGPSNPRSSP